MRFVRHEVVVVVRINCSQSSFVEFKYHEMTSITYESKIRHLCAVLLVVDFAPRVSNYSITLTRCYYCVGPREEQLNLCANNYF